jgi:hypothetical protein
MKFASLFSGVSVAGTSYLVIRLWLLDSVGHSLPRLDNAICTTHMVVYMYGFLVSKGEKEVAKKQVPRKRTFLHAERSIKTVNNK